ncbi:putative glutamine amidotransferase [bacterium A37T11]|nr:putative glutamine amidotransferase [bacterium A37T11]
MSKPIRIGITGGRKYELYASWMEQGPELAEIVRMDYQLDNLTEFEHCDAVVFTGGEDVHPSLYGAPEYVKYCSDSDFDQQRDNFEMKLMERIQRRAVPVLGICRGLQLINVFFGGTLIPDLPSWGKFRHDGLPTGVARDHEIVIDTNSELFRILREKQGLINSLHHQSADHIGAGLVASAQSPDGVVEALEPMNPDIGAFLCLVQWHPERMADGHSPFAKNIREAFFTAIST